MDLNYYSIVFHRRMAMQVRKSQMAASDKKNGHVPNTYIELDKLLHITITKIST